MLFPIVFFSVIGLVVVTLVWGTIEESIRQSKIEKESNRLMKVYVDRENVVRQYYNNLGIDY